MKLNEIAAEMPRLDAEGFYMTKSDVESWLAQNVQDYSPARLFVNPDTLEVTSYGKMVVKRNHRAGPFSGELDQLPVKFNFIGSDCVFELGIKSSKGFPKEIDRDLNLRGCPVLKQLTDCNIRVGGTVHGQYLSSLVGIADAITSVGFELNPFSQMILDARKITEGGIGLILIKGLSRIHWQDINGNFRMDDGPFKIIQQYFGRPDDVFECQEELINAGFEEYAKL